MSRSPNSSARSEKRPEAGSSRKASALDLSIDSIAKELNESLCCVTINASTCLRRLAADPPNVEGARETALRAISCSNRAAEAVSQLRALLSGTNKGIQTIAPSRKGSSTTVRGDRL